MFHDTSGGNCPVVPVYEKIKGYDIAEFRPEEAYGDFLDVEWEFMDSSFLAPSVGKVLDGLANGSRRSLSVVISTDDRTKTTIWP